MDVHRHTIRIAERLVLNYGREYLWFSANLEALNRMDIPEEHKAVIWSSGSGCKSQCACLEVMKERELDMEQNCV